MTKPDDKGPMQGPQKTSDVMKAAPAARPEHHDEDAPEAPHTDAATQTVQTGQEDA